VALALLLAGCGGSWSGPTAAGASSGDELLEVAGVGDAMPFVVGARHSDAISACSVATGGGLIATGSVDGTLRLWLKSNQPVATFRAHADRVQSVAFDSDARVVATASRDGTAAVFRLSDGVALGRAQVVFSELPAMLYGSADASTKSSWQLEFRGAELWLINAASYEAGAPAHERLLGRLAAGGFEFSSKRRLVASHRDSVRAGQVFFSCPLEDQGLLQPLAAPAPWSRMLTSSRRRWLAISRLKSNDPREDEEAWSLLPLVGATEPLAFDPAPGRLQTVVDDARGALAVVRTETEGPPAIVWTLHRLPEATQVASFSTSQGESAFSAGFEHAFYATPQRTLAAADFAGTPAALRLPDANDVRVVAVAPDEKLLAYATETTLVVWSLAAGAELGRLNGEPFVHIEALEFGASNDWLLLNSQSKVSAVDLRRTGAGDHVVTLALEGERFRAAAVLGADLTSAYQQVLLRRQGTLLLATAGSTETRLALQGPRPQAQWALAPDGKILLEARANGELVMVELPAGGSRLIANVAGGPRTVKWLTDAVAAVLGDAGVALLSAKGDRLLIDAVRDEAGALSPVAFDASGAHYAASAEALRQVYRPRWGSSPTAALPVRAAPQTMAELLGSFVSAAEGAPFRSR
jgi:hypothetical protein